MVRTAINDLRREELMQAALECIAANGIAGLTLSQVARKAGSHAPIVSHYFGNKAGLIAATLEFIAVRIRAIYADLVEGKDSSTRLFALAPILSKEKNAIEDQAWLHLVAASANDPDVAAIIQPLQHEILAVVRAELVRAFPTANTSDIDVVAYGLTILGQGHSVIRDANDEDQRNYLALEAARRLIGTLA